MCNLLFLIVKIIESKLLYFFILYLKYQSNSFLDFINDDSVKKNKYKIIKPFGSEGGFGSIFIGYDEKEKREVIIKKISKSKTKEETFNREIEAMRNMKSKYSVEYYYHYSDDENYYIIMEKCDGDLNILLEEYKDGVPEQLIKKILVQLNEAFKRMYELNIIHRDIKPANIFIKYNSSNKKDFTVKLGDFGNSREYNNKDFSTGNGSLGFAAPEQCSNNYDPRKCDLWSIGVTIYYLKYKDANLFAFIQGNVGKYENKLLDDLVKKLIVVDPVERISWKDYFNHPFFK